MTEANQLWAAIGSVRSLLELLPDTPDGVTRLDLCVGKMQKIIEVNTYGELNGTNNFTMQRSLQQHEEGGKRGEFQCGVGGMYGAVEMGSEMRVILYRNG